MVPGAWRGQSVTEGYADDLVVFILGKFPATINDLEYREQINN